MLSVCSLLSARGPYGCSLLVHYLLLGGQYECCLLAHYFLLGDQYGCCLLTHTWTHARYWENLSNWMLHCRLCDIDISILINKWNNYVYSTTYRSVCISLYYTVKTSTSMHSVQTDLIISVYTVQTSQYISVYTVQTSLYIWVYTTQTSLYISVYTVQTSLYISVYSTLYRLVYIIISVYTTVDCMSVFCVHCSHKFVCISVDILTTFVTVC